MSEAPKLLLNLVEESPSEPKFIRSARESKTFKLAVKVDSPRASAFAKNRSPSIALTGDDTPSGQMISTNFSTKADVKNTKTRRSSIDPKTSNIIDAIVQERQNNYKTPTLRPRFDSFSKENGEQTKEQKTIGKVVAMKKMKGIEEQTREKQFDAKLEIFENVKTFVDTRQLFNNSPDGQSESRKSSGEESDSQGFGLPSPLYPSSPRVHYLQVSNVTAKRSSFATGTGTGTPKNLGIQDTFSAAVQATEERSEEDEEEEGNEAVMSKRDQEVQRLYEEFRKNAIEKFGPGIMERAQKKLKDPKEVKKLQKKHKEDLVKMKELQAELEDFDFSRKVMDGLMSKKRSSVDIQKETVDSFDKHIKNELEEEDKIVKPRLPRVSITTPASPRVARAFEQKELKGNNPEEAAQIQLLLKIQQHQQKSDDIIKVLRKKLYGLGKSNVFSEGNTPKIGSQSARKLKGSNGTIETLETEPNNPPTGSQTKIPTMRHSLLRSSLKLDFIHGFDTDTPTSVKSARNQGFLPPINKDSPKTLRGKSKPASPLAKHKEQIMGIRDNLDSLATNRALNDKIRYSIREMAQSYAVPEIKQTPDSLRLPKQEKSTAKLAASLASQIYKDKCIHEAFKV